jgi:hypothetical protein
MTKKVELQGVELLVTYTVIEGDSSVGEPDTAQIEDIKIIHGTMVDLMDYCAENEYSSHDLIKELVN